MRQCQNHLNIIALPPASSWYIQSSEYYPSCFGAHLQSLNRVQNYSFLILVISLISLNEGMSMAYAEHLGMSLLITNRPKLLGRF